MKVIAYFDGNCSLGKRGSGAAIVYDEDGNELARRATYIESELVTANICEYAGLLNALELSYSLGAREVKVLGDSELIIRHFNGRYQCRKEHLKPWLAQVRESSRKIKKVTVQELPRSGKEHRRRNGNAAADALATACIKAGHDL